MKIIIIKSQRKYRSLLLSIILLIPSLLAFGQDVRLSQPFSMPLRLNPAMMCANSDLKLTLNHRSQWNSLSDGFRVYNMNFLYPLFANKGKDKIDLGLSVQNRQYGAFNDFDANLAVGYNLELNDQGHNLSVSIYGGYFQSSLDANSLSFDDQYVNGSYSSSNPTNELISSDQVTYPDAGFGILWFYNPDTVKSRINAYFGISAFHVHNPNESFLNTTSKLPVHQSVQTGIKIMTDGKLDFTPHLHYNVQGGAEELSVGLYADYNFDEKMKATLGGWYREDNSIAFIAGFQHRLFFLGYSYDLGISDLNRAVGGLYTHEITLAFKLNQTEKKELKFNPAPWGNY